MTKGKRAGELINRALDVLLENKRLALFPFLSMCCFLVVFAFFLAPGALAIDGHSFFSAEHWNAVWRSIGWMKVGPDSRHEYFHPDFTGSIRLAACYLISMFFATFFNVALYNEIMNALDGRPVSIAGGLRVACSRWKAIAAWSLFAGIVGIVVQKLQQRLSIFGSLTGALAGLAWSVAGVFVIPLIIREQHGSSPIGYLKISGRIVRTTWGEALLGFAGISFIPTLCLTTIVVCTAVAFHIPVFWISPILFVLAMPIALANEIFKCALFIYATEGVLPDPFEPLDLEYAWNIKSARSKSLGY